jgi:hypothetical protein
MVVSLNASHGLQSKKGCEPGVEPWASGWSIIRSCPAPLLTCTDMARITDKGTRIAYYDYKIIRPCSCEHPGEWSGLNRIGDLGRHWRVRVFRMHCADLRV